MLEHSIKPREVADHKYTTGDALKYRPSLYLSGSTNKDLLTSSLSKRSVSDHSSTMSSNRSTVLDGSYLPEIQPITISSSKCALPSLTFPLSRETSISMNLCDQVVTYDLTTPGLNPRVIIELLKVTKSERASWMIVSAFYRRRGEPRNGISVMKAFIQEMIAEGIQDDSEVLRPAFLLLSGCEGDLVRLAKMRNEPESVIQSHYAAAQGYLLKVFGRDGHSQHVERKHDSFDAQELPGSFSQSGARMEATNRLLRQRSPQILEREMQSLRELHDDQKTELAQLRTLKRKLEDDYSYERNMRRKYERQLEDLKKDYESTRKMERYALDQIKREVATRRKAEEEAKLERKMRQELIRMCDKPFGLDDIVNLCEKKKKQPENIVLIN